MVWIPKIYNECIIVANGNFPTTELPLALLHQTKYIIACDGSVSKITNAGFTPDAIIGDLDSLPVALQKKYADIVHQEKEQESNDLSKAVRYAQKEGFKKVLILGATGLREDHTLGNISLLLEYAPHFESIEIMSDFGLFTPLLHSSQMDCFPKQQISIFSLNPDVPITTSDLLYPISNRCLTNLWQGTLNEALGSHFTITMGENARVIVFRAFEGVK